SGQQQLLIETLLVRFALLDRSVELEDLLRSIGGGGGGSPIPFVRPEPRPVSRAEVSGNSAISDGRLAMGERPSATARAVAPGSPIANRESLIADRPSPIADRLSPVADRASLPSTAEITGKWDALVERLRTGGKPMLATAVEH